MKSIFALSVISFAFAVSSQAAAILADRVVITRTSTFANAFHLGEVEVFEQGSATNVAAGAAGATATASSTGWGTDPNNAINGDTGGAFSGTNFWHDLDGQAGDDPTQADFLDIVFSGPKTVNSFQIWGRNDCCANRDDGFTVDFFRGANLVWSQESGITDGFDTGLTAITAPIPEISTSGLLAAGLLMSGIRRRKA